MICPSCNGKKLVWTHLRFADGRGDMRWLPCTQCEGTGEISEEMGQWVLEGRVLRERRLAARRTLRAEAQRRGIDCATLSKMEMGKIQPVPEDS